MNIERTRASLCQIAHLWTPGLKAYQEDQYRAARRAAGRSGRAILKARCLIRKHGKPDQPVTIERQDTGRFWVLGTYPDKPNKARECADGLAVLAVVAAALGVAAPMM